MRPCGPVPRTLARSTPSLRASIRTDGAAGGSEEGWPLDGSDPTPRLPPPRGEGEEEPAPSFSPLPFREGGPGGVGSWTATAGTRVWLELGTATLSPTGL